MKLLSRKELNNNLHCMIDKPLTLISAPMGFGKTTALISFFQKKNYDSLWLSMVGETDEVWLFKQFIQQIYPFVLDDELHTFSIPSNKIETSLFVNYLQRHLKTDIFIVFDDFDWAQTFPCFYQFIRNICYIPCGYIHFIVISRDHPIHSFLELVYQKRCHLFTKENFTFTKKEIDSLFKKHNIILEKSDLSFIENYSGGWIAAVQLLLMIYIREKNFFNLSSVDRLIETAFYNHLEAEQQVWMLKLSILKSFTLSQAEYLCESKDVSSFICKAAKENAFLRKVGNREYTIIPVLMDMLEREIISSSIVIYDLYKKSGDWFIAKKEPLLALKMYLEIEDFDSIMSVFEMYSDISFTDISPELIKKIYIRMPDSYKIEYPYIYLKWICDNITNVSPERGMELLEGFQTDIVVHLPKEERERAKGEYYFIRAFSHYNDARKMMSDFHKAYDCFGGGRSLFAYPHMVSTFGSFHILYLYFNQLGDLRNLVNSINDNLKYFICISGGVNMGSERQTEAEYAFETGDYEHVEELAILSYEQAKAYQQTSIYFCSLFLRARLALIQENMILYQSMLSQILEIKNSTDFPIIKSGVDCAIAYLSALHNDINLVPEWIQEGRIEHSALLYEATSIGYIAYGQFLITSKEYKKLLAVCERLDDIYSETVHILGVIYGKLYRTIAYLHLYGIEKAYSYFCEMIEYCKRDYILTPLIERSEELVAFLAVFIPKDEYEQRLINEIKKGSSHLIQQVPAYHLSKREHEVMQYVILNKTMIDISKEMKISMNTIQSHMKTIYRKMNVNTKLEAIRQYEKDILKK